MDQGNMTKNSKTIIKTLFNERCLCLFTWTGKAHKQEKIAFRNYKRILELSYSIVSKGNILTYESFLNIVKMKILKYAYEGANVEKNAMSPGLRATVNNIRSENRVSPDLRANVNNIRSENRVSPDVRATVNNIKSKSRVAISDYFSRRQSRGTHQSHSSNFTYQPNYSSSTHRDPLYEYIRRTKRYSSRR